MPNSEVFSLTLRYMNFKDYIRLKAISRFIRKNFNTHEHERKPITLENAQLIGIIFHGDKYEEMLAAMEYAKKLNGFKKKCQVTGLYQSEENCRILSISFL